MHFRNSLLLLLVVISVGGATTQPTGSSKKPTTNPSVAELYETAIQAMHARQWTRAAPLMDRVFASKPVIELERSIVLNHAIVDTQRGSAIRAIRDLCSWSSKVTANDEPFIDILGSALQRAGTAKRVVTTPQYSEGKALCDRLNDQLAQSRPASKRWGGSWLSHEDYERKLVEVDNAKKQLAAAQSAQDAAQAKLARAQAAFSAVNTIDIGPVHVHNDRRDGPRAYCPDCQRIDAHIRQVNDARAKVQETESIFKTCAQATDRAAAAVPQADWPAVLEPITPETSEPATQPSGATASSGSPAR